MTVGAQLGIGDPPKKSLHAVSFLFLSKKPHIDAWPLEQEAVDEAEHQAELARRRAEKARREQRKQDWEAGIAPAENDHDGDRSDLAVKQLFSIFYISHSNHILVYISHRPVEALHH